MANIQDLKASITEMQTSDLINLMKQIRQDRRVSKRATAEPKTKAKSASSPIPKELTLDQLLANMPADAVKSLMDRLSQKAKGGSNGT